MQRGSFEKSLLKKVVPFHSLGPFGVADSDTDALFSRMLNTETQYFPVDSMHTSR